MKLVLLCWVVGFAATLAVLSLADFAPTIYRVAIYPVGKRCEWAGVGTHDIGIFPVLLIVTPLFYGSLIVGCYRAARKLSGGSQSPAQPGASGR
jgi:hypothetical protein